MLSRHACPSTLKYSITRPKSPPAWTPVSRIVIADSVPCCSRRSQSTRSLQQTHYKFSPVTLANFSELGLRSRNPPDSNGDPSGRPPTELSDRDWEMRTGRAIHILQETLPTFFNTGLITSIDYATGNPRESSSYYSSNSNLLDNHVFHNDIESIYSPNVRLAYTPPVPLPSPFPQTLRIEGLPLYMASSVFVRRTMNALYSDLKVTLTKVAVETGKTGERSNSERLEDGRVGGDTGEMSQNREKSVMIRLSVTGIARVSGSAGEWEVESTYTFSPLTGLIHQHTVNSIHPAPHQAVYDSLRLSLGKMFNLGWDVGGGTKGAGAAFKARDGALKGARRK